MYHLNGVGLASFQEYVYPDVPIPIDDDDDGDDKASLLVALKTYVGLISLFKDP
jgi:hypothetical protein